MLLVQLVHSYFKLHVYGERDTSCSKEDRGEKLKLQEGKKVCINARREEKRTDDVQGDLRQGRRKRGDKRAVGHEY